MVGGSGIEKQYSVQIDNFCCLSLFGFAYNLKYAPNVYSCPPILAPTLTMPYRGMQLKGGEGSPSFKIDEVPPPANREKWYSVGLLLILYYTR